MKNTIIELKLLIKNGANQSQSLFGKNGKKWSRGKGLRERES